MSQGSGGRVDSAARIIAAARDRIYAALLDPVLLARWLPPAGMVGEVHELDARPGGRLHMTLKYRDSGRRDGKSTSDSDVVEAEYAELVPNEKVVQLVRFESDDPSFDGTMRMSWLLELAEGGTRVTILAQDVPPGISKEAHEVGLRSSLDNLAKIAEQQVN